MNNMLQALMSNPMQMLMQRGYKLPMGMNDPNQIIQYLMNSGQISQAQYDRAVQMANNFRH